MKTAIRATDSRVLNCKPEEVWEILSDIQNWKIWWPKGLSVKLKTLPTILEGTEIEIQPKGGRSFLCRIVSTKPPCLMKTEYFGDFIQGTGLWKIEDESSGTRVSYELDVSASGVIVAILGKVISFPKIHSRLMVKVLESLEREATAVKLRIDHKE